MKKHNSKHKIEPIDVSKLTTLEDLIHAAMGPPHKNIVNFKMVQAILMILAQQLRMLERPVDYRSLVEDKTAQSDKEKAERVGGEGVKAGTEVQKSESDGEGETAEREDEKSESDGEGETAERESDKPERDRGKREKKEKDRGKGDKTERAREKSKSDRGKGKKADTASEKSERDRGKGKKAEVSGRKSERDRGKGKKGDTASGKSERESEDSERESEDSERESKTSQRESETSQRESETSQRESEISQKESEISQRESDDSEIKSEESERASDKTGGERDKKGRKKGKMGRTKEKTGQESEKTEPETQKEKTEREKEKTEIERDKTEPEKDKTGQEKEKTEPEREKAEIEKEKTEREKEETGPETETGKKGPEKEKTSRKKEKTGQEREQDEPEREKKEVEKEKSEREREKAGAKEKKGREKEKKKREKEVQEKPMIEESYISITDKDKVLVVEKIPTSRRGTIQSRVGSIPVVTLSQFKLLEAAVKALEEKTSPIPFPLMPDNQTLRDEIAKGLVTLTDTMQAMKVAARVQAAEQAINQMAELLTDMAAKGAVPGDVAGRMQSFALDTKYPEGRKRATSTTSKASRRASRPSVFGVPIEIGGAFKPAKQSPQTVVREPQIPLNFVTQLQLHEALRALKDELSYAASAKSTTAQKISEASLQAATNAVQKVESIKGMEDRFEKLAQALDRHSEKLANTAATATSQMDTFNSVLALVRTDLLEGTLLFKSIDIGAETQAIGDINEKYDKLVEMVDMIMDSHKNLATGQHQLNVDLQGILTCVEMLQEEKSDRDEMLDRLRDKADICSLDHLLPAEEFAVQFEVLNDRLVRCHGKFERQEAVWQKALEELSSIADTKSELLQLLKLKEETENQLNEINKKLHCLVFALGEPKAALLARQLSLGGRCGACNKPAIQEIMDKSYIKENDKIYSKPKRLPSAYFSYMGAGDPCEVKTNPPSKEEAKQHVCKRWVGGSHTIINASMKHVEPEPSEALEPTKKYCGLGNDGRLYNMEEPLDPCKHCSPRSDEEVPVVDGAGDTDHVVHVHIIGGPQTPDKSMGSGI